MEKKGNRNASSSRAPGSDLKKNQDVATNKQGVRATPRRREPPCGFSKTAEASRKPQPQRNAKASDKRPKPRGSCYSGNLSRNEETCLEEFNEIELGSVFSPGSKKQSLNHLLNFSLPPRGEQSQPDKIGRFKQNGNQLGTKKHKYNKEHFLQANCQFIVNERGDYRKYMVNPDALVDWDLIEQVNLQVNDKPSCPICLYPPVAAKITKCGHIFCWPCILHYLALSDKETRKCPICYDDIKKNNLKSVITIPHKTFYVDDTITFKLMKRQRDSLTAFPADAHVRTENNIFNFSDLNQDNGYSKLFLANIDNIIKILDRENIELDVLMLEDENCPERCFMEEAKQLLETRRNDVLESFRSQHQQNETKSLPKDMIPADECLDVIDINSTDDSVELPKLNYSESQTSMQSPKYHYFYQADDGQHIYLHAINAKMIEHSYGSLEFGPKTLSGTILEKEGGSMTEELRKKLRYLQHLPVTCQFEVAEIQLSEPIVKKESLDYFKEQIEVRKKRRKRREKDEKRREKRIQADENRKIGIFDTPNLHLDSMVQFPDVRMSHDMFPDYLDRRARTESESTLFSSTDRSVSPDLVPSVSGMSLENTYTGPSFAMMLTSAKKPCPIPKKNKLTNQSSSTPIKLINATGLNIAAGNINIRRSESDPEVEGYEAVPCNISFGDALAEALAKGLDENIDVIEDGTSSSGKKKKKKNKHKLLFSTHMAFPGN